MQVDRLVVLKIFMFKACGIIVISKIKFFNFPLLKGSNSNLMLQIAMLPIITAKTLLNNSLAICSQLADYFIRANKL